MKLGQTMCRVRRMRAGAEHGFTLLELMIVISIMVILMAIAIPNYQRSIVHAREAVLRNDLSVIRSAIDQYTLDKQKGPQRLEDLVSSGYLKQLPEEPITNRTDCWVPMREASVKGVDKKNSGIVDVHSCSDELSSEGTAYS